MGQGLWNQLTNQRNKACWRCGKAGLNQAQACCSWRGHRHTECGSIPAPRAGPGVGAGGMVNRARTCSATKRRQPSSATTRMSLGALR